MTIAEILTRIAEKIQRVFNAGVTKGTAEGIEQGKQAQYDEFWDGVQYRGLRKAYSHAFVLWQENIFYPKYDMTVTEAANMFYRFNLNHGFVSNGMFNLTERLKECNVKLDTSRVTNFYMFVCTETITQVPEISTIGATNLQLIFYGAANLHTVDKLILKTDGTQTFQSAFHNCKALENIVIEGVIGDNISLSPCPLTKESIMGKPITSEVYETLSDAVKRDNVIVIDGVYYYGGIITALKSDASGKTLTLKKTAVNSAFGIDVDDETTYPEGSEYYILRHSKDNWNISYA